MGAVTQRVFRAGLSDAQLPGNIDNVASGLGSIAFVPNLSYAVCHLTGHGVRDAVHVGLYKGPPGFEGELVATLATYDRPEDFDKNKSMVFKSDPRRGHVDRVELRKLELTGSIMNTIAQLFDEATKGQLYMEVRGPDNDRIMRGQFNLYAD